MERFEIRKTTTKFKKCIDNLTPQEKIEALGYFILELQSPESKMKKKEKDFPKVC